MIIKQKIEITRKNWLKASIDFNFIIITPYIFTLGNEKKEAFAFLPNYGSPSGAIIELIEGPDYKINKDVLDFASLTSRFCSFLNIENYLVYDKNIFEEALEDWGKFN